VTHGRRSKGRERASARAPVHDLPRPASASSRDSLFLREAPVGIAGSRILAPETPSVRRSRSRGSPRFPAPPKIEWVKGRHAAPSLERRHRTHARRAGGANSNLRDRCDAREGFVLRSSANGAGAGRARIHRRRVARRADFPPSVAHTATYQKLLGQRPTHAASMCRCHGTEPNVSRAVARRGAAGICVKNACAPQPQLDQRAITAGALRHRRPRRPWLTGGFDRRLRIC